MLKNYLILALMIGSSLGFAASKPAADLPKSGPPIEAIVHFKPMPVGNNANNSSNNQEGGNAQNEQLAGAFGGQVKSRSTRSTPSTQSCLKSETFGAGPAGRATHGVAEDKRGYHD